MRGNQRIELTKRLMQEGLLRLMDQKPLDKITVTELCRESGINRATFYRHYNIPRDVLMEMQRGLSDEFYARFGEKNIEDAAAYLEEFCAYFYDRAPLIRIFIQNCTDEDLMRVTNDAFQRTIEQERLRRAFPGINDAGLKLICTYFVGGGYYMLRQWLMEETPQTPQEIAAICLAFMGRATDILLEGSAR